jgi:hypothetical protein
MSFTKKGSPLLTLDDWERHAGPKRPIQWQDGRSAKEAARAWLEARSPGLPAEIAAIIATHPAFGPVPWWEGEPEVRLPFDRRRGEPRNTDLLLTAEDAMGRYMIAVEAKADETFGELVSEALAQAVERRLVNPRSDGVTRIQDLATALFGPREKGAPNLGTIRYQLLTAAAGALRAATDRKVNRVALLVHEFRTDRTRDERHALNNADLGRFLARLTKGEVSAAATGILYGPIRVPGRPLLDAVPDLYIGKAVRDVRRVGV